MGKGQRSKRDVGSVLGGQTMAAKKQEKSKNSKTILIIAAVVLALAALIGLTIFSTNRDSGWLWRGRTVVKTEHYKVTKGMLGFYYMDTYNNLYSNISSQYGSELAQYFLPDTSKSLKDQVYSKDDNGKEITWDAFLTTQAKETASQYLSLCEAARAAGFKLTKEDKKQINDAIKSVTDQGEQRGYDASNYLRLYYGTGATKSNIKKAMEYKVLALKYLDDVESKTDVKDEKINEKYESDPLKYENVSYLSYTFKADDLTAEHDHDHDHDAKAEGAPADTAGTDGEANVTEPADTGAVAGSDESAEQAESEEAVTAGEPAETKEDAAAADEPEETKEEAETGEPEDTDVKTTGENDKTDDEKTEEAIASIEKAGKELEAVKSEDEFKEYVRNYEVEVLEATKEDAVKKADDTLSEFVAYNGDNEAIKWAFEAKVGDTKVVTSEDKKTVTVYYLVKEHFRDDDSGRNVRHILFGKDDYTDAEATSKEVYDKWIENGATLEEFEKLVTEYTTDPGSKENGGLYENVKRGDMVTEFNDWIFDPERKEGDHDLIETTYGWHIMYYVGAGQPAWKTTIASELRSEAREDAVNKANETYPVKVNEKELSVIFPDRTTN